jgi:hypothetical protein
MEEYPQPRRLNFELIREDLDSVLWATILKVEREPNSQLARLQLAREQLLIMLLRARNSYRTIRFVAADTPPDPNRRPAYMLSIPALNRMILDITFNVLYLFEDLEARFIWFLKAGWREQFEEFTRLNGTYGRYAEWKVYLEGFDLHLKTGARLAGISQDEWPNPGKMPKLQVKAGGQSPALEFLQYLNDWFYRDLSQEAHSSAWGAVRTAAIFLAELNPTAFDIPVDWDRVRAVNVGRTLGLMLSLFSEVEGYFRFGLNERFRYLWCLIGEHVPETKELYEKRYDSLLNYHDK